MVRAINPKRIVIVGGPLAVSRDVENELKKYGKVVRIWGHTRVETSEKILKLLETNNTKVLVNGYDFYEVVAVSKEEYIPAYSEIKVFNPKNVIRIYYDDTVEIYDSQNKRFMGEYKRDEVVEVPKKVIVLIKPNVSTKYCNNKYIAEFGYEMVNTTNYYAGIPIDENSPASLLLSRYLNVPVVVGSGTKPMFYFDSDNSVNNSITIAVDILVLKKTKELYKKNDDDLEQSLNEAKTQLWSKNIPVERYDVPYVYLKNYVEQ
jgi:putative cell wall-binding protein